MDFDKDDLVKRYHEFMLHNPMKKLRDKLSIGDDIRDWKVC